MKPRTRIGRVVAALPLLLALAGPAAASVESELAFHRGVVAYGEDQLDEAQRQFEIVVAADSEDTVAIHYLALIAQKRGDLAGALALYDRAVAIDPEDMDIVLDRGIALMDAGRLQEARAAFDQVIAAEPDRARAQLFAGIATYRSGDYEGAKPYFEKAGKLDPSLVDESRYYTGLADAFAGDLSAAEAAFNDTATQSPLSPQGESAQNLRQQIQASRKAERPWQLALTAGMEYDSNPLIVSDDLVGIPGGDPDGRGVIRPSGAYTFRPAEKLSLRTGYDGYWSFHINETQVNLQTHNPFVSAGYNVGKARLGLRYDYSFTFIDTTDPFRSLHRVTPSVAFQEQDWGLTSVYYQFSHQNFLRDLVDAHTFNRDGNRNLGGINQFFFLPEPFTYVRIGASGDHLNASGTEWSYTGADGVFGAGYDFDYQIGFSWQYHFTYRNFENASALSMPPFSKEREDFRHILTMDVTKGIGEHWEVSLGGSLTWNNSNVAFYQYDRQIGGAYVTYRF